MQRHADLLRGVTEDGDDAAPCIGLDGKVGEIGEDGFDLDTSPGGELLRLCQADPGQMDRRDGVTLFGEPHTVSPLPIAEAGDPLCFFPEEVVGLCAEEEGFLVVAFIPDIRQSMDPQHL